MERCKASLGSKGLIGIKENVTKAGADVDKEDSSVTRYGFVGMAIRSVYVLAVG